MSGNALLQNNQAVKVKTILLDFDGVISLDSVKTLCDTCYQFLIKHEMIDYEVFKDIFKTFMPFPVHVAIPALLESLHIEGVKADLASSLNLIDADISHSIKLIDYCKNKGIDIFVYSTGNKTSPRYKRAKEIIGDSNFILDPEKSKLRVSSYQEIFIEKGIDPSSCLVIDDSPAALSSAKSSGAMTGMMINEFNSTSDLIRYKHFIDHSFTDLDSVIELLQD